MAILLSGCLSMVRAIVPDVGKVDGYTANSTVESLSASPSSGGLTLAQKPAKARSTQANDKLNQTVKAPLAFLKTEAIPDGKLSLKDTTDPRRLTYCIKGAVKEPSKAPVLKNRRQSAGGKLATGTWFTRHDPYTGGTEGFRLDILHPDTLAENQILLYNLAGLETAVSATYDSATGIVSIPRQEIYRTETFGQFSIIPLAVKPDGLYIVDGDLKGTLDDEGNIHLGVWGVIVTQTDNGTPSEYYGKAYKVYTTTIARRPNAMHTFQNPLDSLKTEVLPILARQLSPYEMEIQGLIGTNNSDILSGRITSAGKLLISPQTIFSHSTYGDFKCYPVRYVVEDGLLKYILDKQSPVEFSLTGNKATAEGMLVASSIAPSKYISGLYKDLILDFEVAPTLPPSAGTVFAGEGTASSPYIISSIDDLRLLSEKVEGGDRFANTHFKLSDDIDFSAAPVGSFQPIGTRTVPFEGNFDGNNHILKNMTLDCKGFYLTGVFGYLGRNGSVINLTVKDSKFSSSGDYLGAIAAYCEGIVRNCRAIDCTIESKGLLSGGIAGLTSGGVIDNCSFTGKISGMGSVAGIAGQALAGSLINKCNAVGKFIHEGDIDIVARDLAGICGTAKESFIIECFAGGSLVDNYGLARVGGLLGRSIQAKTERSFTTSTITAKRRANADNDDTYTGGLVAYTMESEFNDCYSSSTIVKTQLSETIGGLCGNLSVSYVSSAGTAYEMNRQSYFRCCFYSGQMRTPVANAKRGIYGTTFEIPEYTGPAPEDQCFIDCWYDRQVNFLSEDKYGRTTLQATAGLPSGYDPAVWSHQAGKYPELKAFSADNSVQLLASAPLMLRQEDTAKKVRKDFSTTAANGIKWAFVDGNGYLVPELPSVVLSGNKATVKDIYDNVALMAYTDDRAASKVYILGITPKLFDGDGTSESPYIIKSVADIKILDKAVGTYGQDHRDDCFKLASDLDFNSEAGFNGIGAGSGNAFSGIFDGAGHKISGLSIDACKYDESGNAISGMQFTGFFGILGEGGLVKDLTIAADNKLIFFNYGGSIAGTNLGSIIRCRNYADISILGQYAGGIAGFNSVNSSISQCYNSGKVYGGNSTFGGIVGLNGPSASVELSQCDGDVAGKRVNPSNGTTYYNIGGIAGSNRGNINRCAVNSTVSGSSATGGIAGLNLTAEGYGDITGCLVTGLVNTPSGTSTRGAVIGSYYNGSKIAGNFYDASINVNGGVNNSDIQGVNRLSSLELVDGTPIKELDAEVFDFKKNNYPVLKSFASEPAAAALRSMFVGFSHGQMRSNITSDIPLPEINGLVFSLKDGAKFSISGNTLKAPAITDLSVVDDELTAVLDGKFTKTFDVASIPSVLKGNGSVESPYLIETPADWNKLSDFIASSKWEYNDSHFEIPCDLDFNNDSIKVLAYGSVKFQGILDGKGHTIKNYLYSNLNSSTTKFTGPNLYSGRQIGLFGAIGTFGKVSNLVLDGSFEGYTNVGALVGELYGTVENVVHKGIVSTPGSTYVAGIAYRVNEGGVISKCVNEGTVKSKTYGVAGIAYSTKAGSLITDCEQKGILDGTYGAAGIVYDLAGGVANCANNGTVKAAYNIAAIAYSVQKTGYLENCRNYKDITGTHATSGAIFGICGMSSTATRTAGADLPGGYIVNCVNYGNIKAPKDVYGISQSLKAGWRMSGCVNYGNITSFNEVATKVAGNATGIVGDTGESGKGSLQNLTYIDNCHNYGVITGKGSKICGIAFQTYPYVIMTNCTNHGNIINPYAGTVTYTSGLVGSHNGQMKLCYNTGNITAGGNAVAGLASLMQNGAQDFTSLIDNCFNLGNISTTFSGTATHGHAAGLVGYFSINSAATWSATVRNSFNAGNISAKERVAGLVAGAFSDHQEVYNCYNSGKVVADSTVWSGTFFVNKPEFAVTSHDCYYDVTRSPLSSDVMMESSAKTTSQLEALKISEDFMAPKQGGYPMLSSFGNEDAALVASAMIKLSDESKENHESVAKAFSLVAPGEAVWSVSLPENNETQGTVAFRASAQEYLAISDGKAMPLKEGDVILTCTVGKFCRDFLLSLKPDQSGNIDVDSMKEIKCVVYFDLDGREIPAPARGSVCIRKTFFTDGSSVSSKIVSNN